MNPGCPFELHTETALITGGATGIGFGIARCMVKAGARVVLVGRRAEQLAKACSELGGSASFVARDITEKDAALEIVASAEGGARSPVSILVNNAGVHLKKPAADTSPEEFRAVLETHVIGAHALIRAAMPGMISVRI